MAEPSLAQQSFLEQRRRRLRAITLARIFIFLLFLLIWEMSARLHVIDAFIFSSPSKIALCFFGMLRPVYFSAHGYDLDGNPAELFPGVSVQFVDCRFAMALPQPFPDSGALPCGSQQPA